MASDAAGVKTSPHLLPPTLATCWLLCNTKHLGNVASQKTIFSHYHFNMLYAQVFHIVQRELDGLRERVGSRIEENELRQRL